MQLRLRNLLTAFFCIATLYGCAGTTKQVSMDKRATTGKFDGNWTARHVATTDTQRYQNWVMNCKKPMDKIALVVADGVIKPVNAEGPIQTFVANNGKFRMEIPLNQKISESTASQAQLHSGKVKVILQGDLSGDYPKGKLVIGIAQFGNSGCTSKFKFDRQIVYRR